MSTLIVDQHGNHLDPEELRPDREPCSRCEAIDGRELTTGFGGYWKVHCRCGNVILSGRGESPREGAY